MTDSASFLGRGVRFPFRPGSTGGFSLVAGEENVAQAMRLILSTALGERQMRYDFGSELPRALFQPITSSTLVDMEEAARDALITWERRIRVVDVSAVPDPDVQSKVKLTIDYVIPQTNARGNLVFPFLLEGA